MMTLLFLARKINLYIGLRNNEKFKLHDNDAEFHSSETIKFIEHEWMMINIGLFLSVDEEVLSISLQGQCK